VNNAAMATRIAAIVLGLAVVVATLVARSGYPRDERADWVLAASSPSSATVRVLAGFGGCSTFRRTDVRETPTQVRISVIVRTAGTTCTSNLLTKAMDITLREPLGSRVILGECAGREGTVCGSLRSLATSAATP
jgi:hypothetical protein